MAIATFTFDCGGGGEANRKSHAMRSSKIFGRRNFYGTKISYVEWNIKSRGLILARNQYFAQGEDMKQKPKSFSKMSELGDVVNKLA